MAKKIGGVVLLLAAILLLMAHSNTSRGWVWYGVLVDNEALVQPIKPHDTLRLLQDDDDDTVATVDIDWDRSNRTITWGVGDSVTDFLGFHNGTFAETFSALVTSDGATVTMSMEQSGGGDMTMQFSSGLSTLDCTPAATIELTTGSDTSPQNNYIYIPQATQVLTKSTSAWSTDEHIKVAFFTVPSAGFTQTNGVYVNQNWNDHTTGTNNQGHMSMMAERSRHLGAKYFSGIDGNGATSDYITIVTNGGSADNVYFLSTAGVVYQMHRHTVPAVDSSGADFILVTNDSGTAYDDIQDVADLLLDSTGASMSGRYFNLVFWGVANKSGEFAPMMVNLPNGSYKREDDAKVDSNGYDVFTMPRAFNRESGTGFLISRITLRHQAASGGTWSVSNTLDLRGLEPSTAAGGGTGVFPTKFPDNSFAVFDEADPTKLMALSVGGLTTATTRTLTVPDVSGTIITTGDTGTVTDGMLASDYSGTGACAGGQYAHTLNDDAAPTCSTPTDTDTLSATIGFHPPTIVSATTGGAWVAVGMGIYPSLTNFSSPTHAARCRIYRTAGVGTCACRFYDQTGAAAIATVSGVTSASTTNVADMGTVTAPAAWAAIVAQFQSSDGATSCGYQGATWTIEE